MTIDGRLFWARVDEGLVKSKKTLGDLCCAIGVSYYTVNTQRKRLSLPKTEQLFDMADFLNMSVEELAIGDKRKRYATSEARAVDEDPDLRAVVRAIMRDRKLLQALSAVIESGEGQRESDTTA